MPLLPNTQQSTSSGDLYILIITRTLAAVGLSYLVRCLVRLSQRLPYLTGLLRHVTIDEDIDMTANGLPSDSFMSLEIGMSDHSNDAASLCPPQRVYISQRLPY